MPKHSTTGRSNTAGSTTSVNGSRERPLPRSAPDKDPNLGPSVS